MKYRTPVHGVLGLLAILLVLLAALPLINRWRNRKKKGLEKIEKYQKAVTARTDFVSPQSEQVVRYFLKLYKRQIEAPPNAPEAIRPIPMDADDSRKRTYELRIQVQNEWKIRRMSIAPLGEGSGSKSICFYVIFDVRMVVKIPPESIDGFDAYYACIRADREIARKLAPRECIVPYISVIMNRVKPLENISRLSPENIEEKYVRELKNDPDLQAYLKIGDRFVFFMDLSRFFFLGNIVEGMHDIEPRIAQEISSNPAILWNETHFESRYGAAHVHLCRDLTNCHDDFHAGVKRIEEEVKVPFEDFQIRKWFSVLLSGAHLTDMEKDLPAGAAGRINTAFGDMAVKRKDVLKEYRGLIRAYVEKIAFRQLKPQMGSICSNLLELLAWMGDQGVAMRDLKPDNLMVIGDRNRYPAFLNSAEEYKIGLIDVETAVDFKPPAGRAIKQPPLGGTPYYATPSHLFTNQMIMDIYGDLPGVLHIQDWHAAMGMIYKVIMGGYLAEKTGRRMSNVTKIMESAFTANRDLLAAAEKANRLFWESAVEEFQNRIDAGREILNSIRIRIPETFRPVFYRVLNDQQENLISQIKSFVESQSFIKSDKLKNALIRATSGQINRDRAKWMGLNPNIGPEKQGAIIHFLDRIVDLKYAAEKLAHCANEIQQPEPLLPTDELLEYMLFVVDSALYLTTEAFIRPPEGS